MCFTRDYSEREATLVRKRVVFTFSSSRLEDAVSYLDRRDVGQYSQTVVIVREPLNHLYTQSSIKMKYRGMGSYLTSTELKRVRRETLRFVEELPQRCPYLKKALDLDGISLWDITTLYMYYPLFDVIKTVRASTKIIDEERPDEILVLEDLDSFLFGDNVNHEILLKIDRSRIRALGSIIAEMATSKGIRVKIVEPNIVTKLRYRIIKHTLPVGVRALTRLSEFRRGSGISTRPHDAGGWRPEKYRGRVVLILRGGHPALAAIPVIKELKKDLDIVTIAADGVLSNSAKRTLEDHRIETVLYERYLNNDVRRRVDDACKKMTVRLHALLGDTCFKESMSYGRVSLWQDVEDIFKFAFSLLFPQVIKYVEGAKEICRVEKPELFLLMDDRTLLERATSMVANRHGIKTLVIQYGALGETLPSISLVADRMAVWGPAVKDLLVRKRRIGPSKLIVTGSTGFEFRAEKTRSQARIESCKQAYSESKIPVVLFTSHPTQGEVGHARRLVDIYAFYRAAKKLQNLRFVVKLHPLESPNLHRSLKDQLSLEHVTVTKDADLYELLDSCDLLVSTFSTTVFEALMLGKPVVVMNFTGARDPIPFVDTGAALGVYSPDALSRSIEHVIVSKEVRNKLIAKSKAFLREYLYKMDGKAAMRVANVAKKMVTNSW